MNGQLASTPPKVFLSHATEDKERFVIEFARKLRAMGLDVWLDQWEMYPGDSLIDKIYEEGLREADAVIVVISSISIQKKWVREELNAATVKRINMGRMLIPVVIDDCAVPEALQGLIWQKISNLDDYSGELGRIVAAITNQRNDKPALGPVPSYATAKLPDIPRLSPIDKIVLKAVGDDVLKTGNSLSIGTEDLWSAIEPLGVPRREFEDSLLILSESGYLSKGREIAPFPTYFSTTVFGLETYALAFVDKYEEIKRGVCSAVLNLELTENDEIAERVQQSVTLIDHVLDVLASRGYIKLAHALGGHTWITDVSPRFRRAFSEGL